jgi:hypothetical protein
MSSSSWLPDKDADLLSFSTNFTAKIVAAPTTYSLTAADATALGLLNTAFTSALASATNPSTRTKTTVAAKNVVKAQLVADIRSLAKRIQASPTVTVPQKTDLGLPIHQTVPTPVPAPSTQPLINLMSTGGKAMTIRLADELTPTKRARPAGSVGAEVYSYVAAAPGVLPDDLEQWRFEGLATKAEFEVDYNGPDVGKTATIVARWYNAKGETGPLSDPITGTIAA